MPTKIEWCHETWNPITGCSPISDGCKNCYARRMAYRLKGRYGYPKDDPFKPGNWRGDWYMPSKKCTVLEDPCKWKKPRMIFVCSMGDLFHNDLRRKTGYGTEWERVYQIFEIMIKNPQHIYLLLTKRPDNMNLFYKEWIVPSDKTEHIWVGATVESPEYLPRIDELLKIKAAVHFVSIEPMLAPMDILKYLRQPPCKDGTCRSLIDWVICGPETGSGKRECKPEWTRYLYEECLTAGIPFFDKTKKNWIAREFPKTNETDLPVLQ